jgi:hypothetical protein
MSTYMTKLEFLLEPYMMFKLGKPFTHLCCLHCIEFSQALLKPYERFLEVPLPKSNLEPTF